MPTETPSVILLAGPNGAGKSTSALAVLKETLSVTEFVNADVIAQGLSGFAPQDAALAAGRVMLARIGELSSQRVSFALETTLSGRSLARRVKQWKSTGYEMHLIYVWLPSVEAAILRVADRVRMGGHDVPKETIRRRYHAGLHNFFKIYRPLATTWQMYDNSALASLRDIASGTEQSPENVVDQTIWTKLKHEYSNDD